MANTFFISDSHFGQVNILTFTNSDGSRLRPFLTVEEMNETMVERWNNTVRPHDKVYHLGDIAMSHKHLPILGRLNGEKVLIKGNHDTGKISQYMPYFKDIRGSHQFDAKLLSHIPVHPSALYRWSVNIHGHLHSNNVLLDNGELDRRYFNVSVEQINYTPISYDELQKALTT